MVLRHNAQTRQELAEAEALLADSAGDEAILEVGGAPRPPLGLGR